MHRKPDFALFSRTAARRARGYGARAAVCAGCAFAVLALIAAPISATAQIRKPPARAGAGATCRGQAALLRNRLALVVDAAVEQRPELTRPAIRRTMTWWRENRHHVGRAAGPVAFHAADSTLRVMVAAGRVGNTLEAARAAVSAAQASFGWCREARPLKDQLMCLRLAGLSAWLRANGVAAEAPECGAATGDVAAALRQLGRGDLAGQLESAVAAAQEVPVRDQGATRPGLDLLELLRNVRSAIRR